jgi:hypothetical protein
MENISPIIRYFVEQGVPLDTVILLFMLPIIVTLIAFFRQVIGIKAFGIYTPAIVTFAFLAIPQLRYGVIIFVSVILIGMLMRFILKSLRILYLPRVAITQHNCFCYFSNAWPWRINAENRFGFSFDFSDINHDYNRGKICGYAD